MRIRRRTPGRAARLVRGQELPVSLDEVITRIERYHPLYTEVEP